MNAPHPSRIAIALGVVSGAVVMALLTWLLHGPDRELGTSNDLLCTQLNSSCLAMVTDAPQLRRLFILGVDVTWMGRANVVSINWQRLKDLRRRTVLTVRMQGQLNWVNQDEVLKRLQDVLRQARAAGVAVEGIYFEYRGARGSLEDYADFLGKFRSSLQDPKFYVITSIDASWLASDDLIATMDKSDEVVLLGDNVSESGVGVFNTETFHEAIKVLGRRAKKPFHVAISTQGVEVYLDGGDRLVGTTDNLPAPDLNAYGGQHKASLFVNPMSVQELLQRLREASPKRFTGYQWVSGQDRPAELTWAPNTVQKLMASQPLDDQMSVMFAARKAISSYVVTVKNTAANDAPMPKSIPIPDTCHDADGDGGYFVNPRTDGPPAFFQRNRLIVLGPGSTRAIGTVTCERAPPTLQLNLALRDNAP